MPKNKGLLKLYEASLPSWTVVLAQYGYYKPWFRFAVRYIIFLASLITMSLGFWDLYKNVPVLRDLFSHYMESFMQVIDSFVVLRLSLLLGYIISFSSPVSRLLSFIFQPGVFGALLTHVIEPLF